MRRNAALVLVSDDADQLRYPPDPQRGNNSELAETAADQSAAHGLLLDEDFPGAVEHESRLLIEELLQGYRSPQDLLGEEGLFRELKKRLLERALGAELSEHLGYEKGDPVGRGSGNTRTAYSSKTVLGDDGSVEIAVPRYRNASFAPQIVPKGQTRLDGFDPREAG